MITQKSPLPQALRQALLAVPHPTCLMVEANGVPAAIFKADAVSCSLMSLPAIPIAVTPQLHLIENGAVFRFEIEFRYTPGQPPIGWDTFLNPGSPRDLELLRLVGDASALDFHVFRMDSNLSHVCSKRIPWNKKTTEEIRAMIAAAVEHNAGIPAGQKDYDAALNYVQKTFKP